MNLEYTIDNSNPATRKKRIRDLFDSIVPTYTFLNRLLSLGIDVYWRRSIPVRLGDIAGRLAIDLCCGTGDLSRILHAKKARVISVDFSLPMIRTGIAGDRIRGFPVAADSCLLPFRDGCADIITIAFGIRNIPDLDNFVAEVKRVLRPGGTLAVLELTRPRHRVIRWLYANYLQYVVPVVGGLISGEMRAYRYLSKTIATFLDADSLADRLVVHGLSSVICVPKTFGIATILICKK